MKIPRNTLTMLMMSAAMRYRLFNLFLFVHMAGACIHWQVASNLGSLFNACRRLFKNWCHVSTLL